MINKGVIMEISKKYIIILSENGEYLKLKPKKGIYISQEIYYTQNDLYKKKISYTRLSSIAAVFIMCFAIASFFYLNNPVQSYGEEWAVVSVDINPSIEISLNDQYIVRSVIPLNDDAKQLISDKWIGKDFELVMTMYIDSAVETKYLKEEGTVLLAYYSKDQNIKEAIEEKFEKIINNSKANNPNIAYVRSSEEDLENARKEKISLGRYGVYKEISEESGQIMEKARKGKVKDLIEKSKNVKMIKFKNKKNQNEDIKNENKDNKNNNQEDNKHEENRNQNENNGKPDKINPGKGLDSKPQKNSEEINVNDEKNKNRNNNGNKNEKNKIQDENQNNKPNENNGKPDKINPGKGLDSKPQKNSEEINVNDEKNENEKQLNNKSEENEETISEENEKNMSEDNSQGNDNVNNQNPINKDEATQNKNKPQSQKDSDEKGNTNSKGENHSKKDKRVGS